MAPFAFQAARSARELGLLAALLQAGGGGTSATDLERALKLPATSVSVLLDACLAIDLVAESTPGRWTLTTIGEAWLLDRGVIIDADFAHDVCWPGMADLAASLRTAKPVGLARFGPWATIYEGLAALPESIRKPWFAYDHGHSDTAFPTCIEHLRKAAPKRLLDVGGNTGRFATVLLRSVPDVSVTILDHPGQIAEAERNLAAAGFAARARTVAIDLLDHARPFPTGQDAVWMSQFLDCFGPADVVALMRRGRAALAPGGTLWVLEVCPDRQTEPAAAASLRLSSLYFTAIANGVSRFYRASDLLVLAEAAGLRSVEVVDGIGSAHSLFRFSPV